MGIERTLEQKQLICEFLGTFLMLLGISLVSQHADPTLRHISIACVVMSLIFSFGFISKAQFNPAVSLSMWILGVFPTVMTSSFIGLQFTAGVCGSTLGGLLGNSTAIPYPQPEMTAVGATKAFVAEFIFTFYLVIVSLQMALSEQRKNHFFGLAIGACVAASFVSINPISGSVLNPAVTVGLIVAKCALTDSCADQLRLLPLYLTSQFLAGLFGTLVYRMLQPLPAELEAREMAVKVAGPLCKEESPLCLPSTSSNSALLNVGGGDEEIADYDVEESRDTDGLCCPPNYKKCSAKIVTTRRRTTSTNEVQTAATT